MSAQRRAAQCRDGIVWYCDVCGRLAGEFTPAGSKRFLQVWPCGHFNPKGMAWRQTKVSIHPLTATYRKALARRAAAGTPEETP